MDENDYYEDIASVVVDIGEKQCKFGHGGGKTCHIVQPTLVAKEECNSQAALTGRRYGEHARIHADNSSSLTLQCPLSRGVVQNWQDFEDYFEFSLGTIDPSEHTFLLSGLENCRRINDERLAQFMFESLNVVGLYIANPGVLAIASSGRSTGLCLSCGEGTSRVLPFHRGNVLKEGMSTQNLAGRDVTLQLKNLMSSNSDLASLLYLRELKERHCFAVENYETAKAALSAKHISHTQDKIQYSDRFGAPEVLFQPSLRIEREDKERVVGLPELVYRSVMRCGEQERKDLLSAVILEGGTSMMPGFVERFTSELSAMVGNDYDVKVIAAPERNKSVWLGGSILASLSCMGQLWISRPEYAEYGPDIVHRLSF